MANVVGNWGGGNVWRVTSGEFSSNAYFCEAQVEGGGILIDAGLDGETIDAELREHGFHPHAVYCTHGHFDHTGSASHFQKKYGSAVFVPKADLKLMKASNFLLMAMKIQHKVVLPEATLVAPDHVADIAGTPLRYLPAPGHTPGSCIIEFGNAWFTGDTLYARGVGLSHLPGEDHAVLKQTILGYWQDLTPERTIYPGHGNAADGESVRTGNAALLNFLGLAAS
ncbi:MBL fold metallo-hydrolase [Duganella sp. FT135W]|uniref:MBL fold metallo-hydrolase n=1 Tax=Duganella flavida TaxID=2692175 RepID=A0A6L8KDC7_9BURK|nr:MBL fold metallo-hydrolase [Duganella flavida]MYM25453.1 MBL fold metallo-hydrolase [Duganella flavida]